MDLATSPSLRLVTALAATALFAARPAPSPHTVVVIITLPAPREARPWCWQRECCPCGVPQFRVPMNAPAEMWPVILSYDSQR